jgi:glycerophosphoryl diester phosphodiesterase
MKYNIYLTVLLAFFLWGCAKDNDLAVPDAGPNSIMKDTRPIPQSGRLLMEGVYKVAEGSDFFGDYVVVKWSKSHVLIANSNGKYMNLQAGHLDSVIFLQGYWRNGYSDGTGLISFTISRKEGGSMILGDQNQVSVAFRGSFGNESGLPDKSLVLVYSRPFSDKVKNEKYYILAHRGGGRTSDLLPHSENSLAMLGFAEQLGSTGVEIDVRTTKDGVPFLYHDGDINIRLTQKSPLAGPIENYTLKQLRSFVRLIHGEQIPTLEEALNFVLDSTNLQFVYLDMKAPEALAKVIPIQMDILLRAQVMNRDLMIVIGIPSTDILDGFLAYPGFENVPSLCELSVDDVRTAHSLVWAPRWTLGTQSDLVRQMHDEGRSAVTWTIDQPQWISEFMRDGLFDGMLTNFPYVVAYHHYTKQ